MGMEPPNVQYHLGKLKEVLILEQTHKKGPYILSKLGRAIAGWFDDLIELVSAELATETA